MVVTSGNLKFKSHAHISQEKQSVNCPLVKHALQFFFKMTVMMISSKKQHFDEQPRVTMSNQVKYEKSVGISFDIISGYSWLFVVTRCTSETAKVSRIWLHLSF